MNRYALASASSLVVYIFETGDRNKSRIFFAITAEIHARSLANFYGQYVKRRSENGQFDNSNYLLS